MISNGSMSAMPWQRIPAALEFATPEPERETMRRLAMRLGVHPDHGMFQSIAALLSLFALAQGTSVTELLAAVGSTARWNALVAWSERKLRDDDPLVNIVWAPGEEQIERIRAFLCERRECAL